MDVTLHCPFTMLVCGPSSCGKSVFTRRLLANKAAFGNPPKKIVWCYGVWQDEFKNDDFEYHRGLPTEEILEEGNMVLVLDDLMQQAKSSQVVSDIFTKLSHHRNITCICLMQNLFPKGSEIRNISLNSNYIVVMKNTRDQMQIRHLARQIYPGNSKFLIDAYQNATIQPYSYLLLDFTHSIATDLKVRTGILPGETYFVYVPKTI